MSRSNLHNFQDLTQTKAHGVLWQIANFIFLGFPSLCNEIKEAWGRGRTTKEVTLHQPLSMGTVVEREVEEKLGRNEVYAGLEGFLYQGSNDRREQGLLERFTLEIKPKLEKEFHAGANLLWNPQQQPDLWRAVRQDVENRRIQLAALAPNHKQRFEARVRLQLALLRFEGVRIALDLIRDEQIMITRLTTQANEQKRAATEKFRAILNAPTTSADYRSRYEQLHLNQLSGEIEEELAPRILQVNRQIQSDMIKKARNWSLEQMRCGMERARGLAKLCEGRG